MTFANSGTRIILYTTLLIIAFSNIGSRLSGMVKPDAVTARSFGLLLQSEFRAKKSAAFIERIDAKAFKVRLFGNVDVHDSFPWANWPDNKPPTLTGPMSSLNAYTYLYQFRVTLDNDIRTLDCDFLSEKGGFHSARFFLSQSEGGTIRIADFQWGGDAMSKSQMVRQTLLLKGAVVPQLWDSEEEQLAAYGKQYGKIFMRVVDLYAQGDSERSFAEMRNLPVAVRRTRICRHYLTCQFVESKEARRELEQAIRNGDPFDPIFRFDLVMEDKDHARALATLDDISRTYGRPAYYEGIKAALLLEDGRFAEAFAVARSATSEEPLTGSYLIAVRSLVAMNRRAEAIDMLQEWNWVVRSEDINQILTATPALKDFCSSSEYLQWKHRGLPAQPEP